jgi:hypothetical protein
VVKNQNITTGNITLPIHQSNNIGSAALDIMKIYTNFNGTTGPILSFSGFTGPTGPTTFSTFSSDTNIRLTPIDTLDNYTNIQDRGFYLNGRFNITIYNTNFQLGLNTFDIVQKFINGGTETNGATGKYNFYYDTPITTGPTGTITSLIPNTTTYISGVQVIGGTGNTGSFIINTNSYNMGNTYYSSPVIRYEMKYNNNATTIQTTSS